VTDDVTTEAVARVRRTGRRERTARTVFSAYLGLVITVGVIVGVVTLVWMSDVVRSGHRQGQVNARFLVDEDERLADQQRQLDDLQRQLTGANAANGLLIREIDQLSTQLREAHITPEIVPIVPTPAPAAAAAAATSTTSTTVAHTAAAHSTSTTTTTGPPPPVRTPVTRPPPTTTTTTTAPILIICLFGRCL
jgi:hypothetical protein